MTQNINGTGCSAKLRASAPSMRTPKNMPQKTLLTAAAITSILFCNTAAAGTLVNMTTSAGSITIELEDEKAPLSAKNFIHYVESGFYNDTLFHRVIPGFVIQGGGFSPDMTKKATGTPVKNEADNGLKNTRYSLSMARTSEPDSASSQFFINLRDNRSLDHTGKTPYGWGYAVFGRVIEGQEIVDQIATVKTSSQTGMRDVPVEEIRITTINIKTSESKL